VNSLKRVIVTLINLCHTCRFWKIVVSKSRTWIFHLFHGFRTFISILYVD